MTCCKGQGVVLLQNPYKGGWLMVRYGVFQMSNNGYIASASWVLASILDLVLPSFRAVSPATELPTARAAPSGSVASSLTASSASLGRLRAAFWFQSWVALQLGHVQIGFLPKSLFTSSQAEHVLLLGYRRLAATTWVPYHRAL